MKKLLSLTISVAMAIIMGIAAYAASPSVNRPQPYTAEIGGYTVVIATPDIQSGVYQGERLMYTLADTGNIDEVFLSSNGQNMAILHSEGSDSQNTALVFLNGGVPTQRYTISDMAFSMFTKENDKGIVWQKSASFNPDTSQLSVSSVDKSVRVFDIRTGELISQQNPVKLTILLGGAAVLAAAVLVYWRSPYNKTKAMSDHLRKEAAQKACEEQKKEAEQPAIQEPSPPEEQPSTKGQPPTQG